MPLFGSKKRRGRRQRCSRGRCIGYPRAFRGALTTLLENCDKGCPSTSVHELHAFRRVMIGSHAVEKFFLFLYAVSMRYFCRSWLTYRVECSKSSKESKKMKVGHCANGLVRVTMGH